MARGQLTLTLDEEVLNAVKARAARTGKNESEVIEDALRSALGLGPLARLSRESDLCEREAMALAVEAQHRTRSRPV